MRAVAAETDRLFARTLVTPNLLPPVVFANQAINYRRCIRRSVPKEMNFEPLITLHLTEVTDPAEV